jgi:hypothetical protein
MGRRERVQQLLHAAENEERACELGFQAENALKTVLLSFSIFQKQF